VPCLLSQPTKTTRQLLKHHCGELKGFYADFAGRAPAQPSPGCGSPSTRLDDDDDDDDITPGTTWKAGYPRHQPRQV
jgi:hypothetical protein